MNVYIAVASLIILIFLLIFQLKTWKIRALLSPGFYFSIVWGVGILGLLLFKSLNLAIETYPEYIDELNILIGFTGICFAVLTKKGLSTVNKNKIVNLNFIKSFSLFKLLSLLILIVALYVFFSEGKGLNFGEARENMHETLANRNVLISYLRLISTPLSIYAGFKLVSLLINYKRISFFNSIILLVPFCANIFFSFTEGGRVSMVYSMIEYVIGVALTIPMNFKIGKYKKILVLGLFVALFINIMITWIDNERDKYHQGNDVEFKQAQEKMGVFSFLFGASRYVYSSYIGYQYRRVDAVSSELGYGQYTFNGFINWQLPFMSQLGFENSSIADLFNIYYFNQDTYDYSRDYYYVTHSAYIPIVKDYGFYGSFIAIFILVYIAHLLFIKIQKCSAINKSITFFFYYLFFIYWIKSNFYGTLSNSILIPLYGFLIVDILNYFYSRKRYHYNSKF